MTGANLGDPPRRPLASDANPQYTGSAIINSIDYFGVADGNGEHGCRGIRNRRPRPRLCEAGVMLDHLMRRPTDLPLKNGGSVRLKPLSLRDMKTGYWPNRTGCAAMAMAVQRSLLDE